MTGNSSLCGPSSSVIGRRSKAGRDDGEAGEESKAAIRRRRRVLNSLSSIEARRRRAMSSIIQRRRHPDVRPVLVQRVMEIGRSLLASISRSAAPAEPSSRPLVRSTGTRVQQRRCGPETDFRAMRDQCLRGRIAEARHDLFLLARCQRLLSLRRRRCLGLAFRNRGGGRAGPTTYLLCR